MAARPRSTKTGAYKWPAKRRMFNGRMFRLLKKILPRRCSVVDIGAGRGDFAAALRKRGHRVVAFDGSPNVAEASGGLVERADLTEDLSEFFDCAEWGLFIEVGEHVPEQYFHHVLDQVSRMPTVGMFVRWATPNDRPNSGHVNCHSPVYIASQFAAREWFVDEELTLVARAGVRPEAREKTMVLKRKRWF